MIITINWYKGTFTIHMKYGNKSINFSGPKYHTAEFGVSLKEVKLPSTKVSYSGRSFQWCIFRKFKGQRSTLKKIVNV